MPWITHILKQNISFKFVPSAYVVNVMTQIFSLRN